MPPTINDLPPELLEEIVDGCTTFPKKDQNKTVATLRALSQTSSAFRPLCQSKLFSSITIITDFIEYAEDTNPLDRLYELFVKSDRLAQYATHLTILDKKKFARRSAFADQGKTQRGGEHTLTKLLALLQTYNNLEEFTIVSVFPSRHHYTYHKNLGRAKALMKAIIEIVRMPSLVRVNMKDGPLGLVHFCTPNVKHLVLWDAWVDEDLLEEDKIQPPVGQNIQLETLVVYSSLLGMDSFTLEEIVDSEFLDLSGLRKLSVGLEHCPSRMVEKMHGHVVQLLGKCSSSLEELSLTPSATSFDPSRDPPLGPEPISFVSLKSLRVLHLGIQTGLCEDIEGNNHEPIPWVSGILNTLSSPNVLESLTISSGYGQLSGGNDKSYWGVSFDDYVALDGLLGGQKFSGLKSVRWFIEESRFLLTKFEPSYTTPEEFAARTRWVLVNIHGRMPQLKRKKKLVFEFAVVFPPMFAPAVFAHRPNI